MAFTFTRGDIDRLCPRPRGGQKAEIWDAYVAALIALTDEINEAGINTPLIGAHAMAQWGAESGFTILWESGNYSAQRILQIFGEGRHSAAVTPREAKRIAALPTDAASEIDGVNERTRVLFERVYGQGNPRKAAELGNTHAGDGYAFRGCGPVQITGRRDHERFKIANDHSAKALIRAALMEWKEKGCSAKAESDDCRGVTRLINGGYNGLQEREALLRQAKTIWSDNVDEMLVPVLPEPAKADQHLVVVATKSNTVRAALLGVVAAVGDGVSKAVDAVSGLFGKADDIQNEVDSLYSPVTSILGTLKLNAPEIGLAIGAVCLVIVVWRHIELKQQGATS